MAAMTAAKKADEKAALWDVSKVALSAGSKVGESVA